MSNALTIQEDKDAVLRAEPLLAKARLALALERIDSHLHYVIIQPRGKVNSKIRSPFALMSKFG